MVPICICGGSIANHGEKRPRQLRRRIQSKHAGYNGSEALNRLVKKTTVATYEGLNVLKEFGRGMPALDQRWLYGNGVLRKL